MLDLRTALLVNERLREQTAWLGFLTPNTSDFQFFAEAEQPPVRTCAIS